MGRSANTSDGARLLLQMDSGVKDMIGCLLMCTFSTLMPLPTGRSLLISALESMKWGSLQPAIGDVEHASFTPLVLSASGSLDKEASMFYKRLASLLADKWDQPYNSTINWLRCRISFSFLRSAIQCLCGARSSLGHAIRSSACSMQ